MDKEDISNNSINSESDLQKAIVGWCKLNQIFCYSIPNEGRRGYSRGRLMKSMGLESGMPDLCIPYKRGGYGAYYIELKFDKNDLSSKQIEKHSILEYCGNRVDTFWEYADAIESIANYMSEQYLLIKCPNQ